ncbi:MAG: NYN domain-containing protein [Chloroflexi bacterium]|nr:NYN domain-containing protein [Chloroflexota bacterium]
MDSPNSMPAATQGDVAVFVDWENLKFSLAQRDRRPNVTALREAAERFGRIVYARAYADWQDPVHAGDPASLYMAALEPVYVLTKRYIDGSGEIRIKNSVDVKLAADCIEASHQFPNVTTYIIVSGDHGFLHVVNTLRPHGKQVVVIGVSWTTAAQLTDLADVVLYYDLDVEPTLGEPGAAPATPPAATKKLAPVLAAAVQTAIKLIRTQGTSLELTDRGVADALELVMEVAREYRGSQRDLPVSILGQEMQKRMSAGDFQRYGKGRARVYSQAAGEHGLLRVVSRDFTDWIFLPDEPLDRTSAPVALPFEGPRYDYAGYVWSDLPEEKQTAAIVAINDLRNRPGTDWLTFKPVQACLGVVLGKDEYASKNLTNNMLAIGVLRADASRDGFDPATGATYRYNTIALDLQHPDVRRALKLG